MTVRFGDLIQYTAGDYSGLGTVIGRSVDNPETIAVADNIACHLVRDEDIAFVVEPNVENARLFRNKYVGRFGDFLHPTELAW